MIKIYNKIVESIKAPENKNDIWLNKGVFHIYKQGEWKPFTVDLATANKLKEMAEKGVLLTPGEGIIIEDNEINLTLKTVNGESIIGEGNIIIESSALNAVESEEVASTIPTPEFPYVTKSELTELSAEVSGLSERIDNLPSAESEVFEAIYGETTYNEIIEAYNEGKVVFVKKGNFSYYLNRIIADTGAYFFAAYQAVHRSVVCLFNNAWSEGTINMGVSVVDNGDGTLSLTANNQTAEVATPQYVENLLGTIINGDY